MSYNSKYSPEKHDLMKMAKYFFILLCFIPLLLFRDFTPNNELKYLSIVDEALQNGHFFTFYNHGIPYADKPPLYFWIIMLGKWLFGEHYMIFIGLFSLIPALIILYIMDQWVQQSVPSEFRVNAQFMLITSGLFTGAAIVLRMDMLMCMFIILALYTFYKLYTGTSGKYDFIKLPVFIFLALFSKGPVGIIVPLLSISMFLLLKGQLRKFSYYLGWKQWSILIGLCVLWFGGVYREGGPDYLYNLLFHQTVNRAVDAFHHKEPFWYYIQTLWYVLAPWTLLYIFAIIIGLKKKLLNTDLKKFFLTIICSTFIVLSLFSSKLDIYLLPVYPFITYLAVLFLPDIRQKYINFSIILPAILLSLALPASIIATRYSPNPLPQNLLFTATLILTCFSLLSLYYIWKKQLTHSTNSLAVGLLLTILIGSFAIPGENEYLGFRKISQKAATIAYENGITNFYFFKFRSGENLDVYLNQKITRLDSADIDSINDKQKSILFVKNKDLKRNGKLSYFSNNKKLYTIGNYSIIVF